MKFIRYLFILIKDVGSISVNVIKSNSLRDLGGLVYYKVYNLNKD